MPFDVATVASAVFQCVLDLFNLYFGIGILTGALGLWLLRRVAMWFRGLH